MSKPFKIPQSVLVVIHTPALDVLVLRRTDGDGLGAEYWQSVTGSKDRLDEDWRQTAEREVFEETGIVCTPQAADRALLSDWQLENVYDIYPQWLHRYAPGVARNTERLFGLQVPLPCDVRLSPREHTAYQWLPYRQAAEVCFSPSNAEAILQLPRFAGHIALNKESAV
ncbi:MAG: dihydroneopterin triphosphate diphosphatase [Pseudomonadota bacterium]